MNQFWRADIAGLYALAPGGGSTIRLIELRTALADERPGLDLSPFGRRKPLGGYWFRAIRHAEEQTIDATARFAAVAFPDRPAGKTRWTYIIDENNTVYRAALGAQRGIEVFPADDDLKRQWSKLD